MNLRSDSQSAFLLAADLFVKSVYIFIRVFEVIYSFYPLAARCDELCHRTAAAGNDGMIAFRKKTNFRIPDGEGTEARYIITEYLRTEMAAGRPVERPVEGRIRVVR